MRFVNEAEAITYIFQSLRRLDGQPRGRDEDTRDVTPTRRLLGTHGLIDLPIEYAVVTGSKGKGSTTAITAKLLQHLGHTVGMITSPHLVSYRERIRVNGRAIPEADLLRLLDLLAPEIDAITAGLNAHQYFSPQGIFLAVGLAWFREQGVSAAVLEVGRGGRFDDVAVVPNRLSLFTPILLEHVHQLGPTLSRIAWHKAGIIKPVSYAYSVPQATEVLAVLQAEADAQNAEFAWIAPMDMGEYLGMSANGRGIHMRLGRYGDVTLSLLGTYQVQNATLAVQGAGNLHGRLSGVPHGSPEYVDRIRAGLADVRWAGRTQQLATQPDIYIDGVTTVIAAEALFESLHGRLNRPIVTITAVPYDRDYEGVFRVVGALSDAVIVTENSISPNVRFPPADVALGAAARYNSDVAYASTLSAALERARLHSGRDGTILIAGAQPLVGEAMQLWNMDFEVI